MPEPENNKSMLSEEEFMKLLLQEDDTFHDEGRDLYMSEVLSSVRRGLGDDGFDFGRGMADQAGSRTARFGRNALLVTGRSSAASGLRDRILAQLENAGVSCTVFEGVGSNPLMTSVDVGAAVARESGCDVVLAVGGGSQIDAAKAMALVAGNGGSVRDYTKGRGNAPGLKVLPVIAVPTTCGTGSEVNGFSVLTDPDTRDKAGMACSAAVPKVALVDPSVMETMPQRIMSAVSFDALCHLMEAFVSSNHDDVSDAQCRRGMAMMAEGLVRANEDIRDEEALDKVVYASALAGIPIYTKGTVAGHALEHPLSGLRNIAHGRGLAAVTPEIMRRNAKGAPERYAEISRIFGGKDENDVGDVVQNLIDQIGVTATLSSEGFNHDDIEWLTGSALRTVGSKMERNPVHFTADDIRSIYEACL